MNHLNSVFFSVTLLLLQCTNPASKAPDIFLDYFPNNGGTIEAVPDEYKIGDRITLIAHSKNDHYFYKWQGDTTAYDSVITFVVDERNRSYCALFPVDVIADSQIIIGNYPPSLLKKGESAEFELALNVPLDSTYTVYATCPKYDYFTFCMGAKGNSVDLLVGCRNDSATVQSEWSIDIRSDKLDSFIIEEPVTFEVTWQ